MCFNNSFETYLITLIGYHRSRSKASSTSAVPEPSIAQDYQPVPRQLRVGIGSSGSDVWWELFSRSESETTHGKPRASKRNRVSHPGTD